MLIRAVSISLGRKLARAFVVVHCKREAQSAWFLPCLCSACITQALNPQKVLLMKHPLHGSAETPTKTDRLAMTGKSMCAVTYPGSFDVGEIPKAVTRTLKLA